MQTEVIITIIVVMGFIGLVGFVIVLYRQYEQKRTEALQSIATSLKLGFSKLPGDTLLSSLSNFPLFSQGHSRKAKNVMSGKVEEIDIKLFDYRYTTGGGKHQQTHNQTVVVLSAQHLDLPAFSLKPQNVFHNIGKAFGYQDIDFTSNPLFSDKYLLRASDENAVRLTFTPDILEYFEQRLGISTEAGGNQIVFFRAGKKVKPEDLPQFLKDGLHIYTLFKHFGH